MAEQQQQFAAWAVIELMGHQMIAGYVTEQQIAGAPMLRVDVPAVNGTQPFTKFFGASAIYGITPTTQELATHQAQYLEVLPFKTYAGGGRITFSMRGLEIGNSQNSKWRLIGELDEDGSEDSQEEADGEEEEEGEEEDETDEETIIAIGL